MHKEYAKLSKIEATIHVFIDYTHNQASALRIEK